MKEISKLLNYHFAIYIRAHKIVIPVVTWVIFLYFSYTIFPIEMVSSTITSCIAAFYIMVWIGFTYYDIENPVSEQIMILRVKNEIFYFITKIIFLSLLCLIISFIGIIVPLLQNATHGFEIYTRDIRVYDIIISYFLHMLATISGVIISGLFHPRIIKNRKLASLLVLIISVMAIVKGALNGSAFFLKYITWIFPPLDDFAQVFTNKIYFELRDIIQSTIVFITYTFVVGILQIYLLRQKKF